MQYIQSLLNSATITITTTRSRHSQKCMCKNHARENPAWLIYTASGK